MGTMLEVIPENWGMKPLEVLFLVEASWRGAMPDTVRMIVHETAPCGFYVAGVRAVIAADRTDRAGIYQTGVCDEPKSPLSVDTLGPPDWHPSSYPDRQLDREVVPIGSAPHSNGNVVRLTVAFSEEADVAHVWLSDREASDTRLATFMVPEGMYRLRVQWADGTLSETYALARCPQKTDNGTTCSVMRFYTDLRLGSRSAG